MNHDDAQAHYSAMVKEHVTPTLRRHGFRGTASTWARRSETGDAALVNLQKSRWNHAEHVAFTVNLSLVPLPWFDWQRRQFGPRKEAREYDGLWRDRLRPPAGLSQDGQFWLVGDAASAHVCGLDVAEQLKSVGIPRLMALLDRTTLMEAVRAGEFGYLKMDNRLALIALLTDDGPGAELEERIKELPVAFPQWARSEDFAVWARERSELRRLSAKE